MGFFSSILPVVGTVVGGFFGGPAGAAIGGALGGAIAGKPKPAQSGAASATQSGVANAADPFAQYRPEYQQQLQQFMQQQKPPTGSQLYSNTGIQEQIASQQGTLAGQQLEAMTAPGAHVDPSDPSYQFRFQQGIDAVARSGAAKGFLGSGNLATALSDYGQQSASQEYQAQFQRLSNLSQQQSQQQQQQFNQWSGINQQNAAIQGQGYNQQFQNYQQQYNQLSQLSGVNAGSPGQAATLLQQQQAGSAAATQNLVKGVVGQVGSWFGGSGSGSSSGGPATPSGLEQVPSSGSSGWDAFGGGSESLWA